MKFFYGSNKYELNKIIEERKKIDGVFLFDQDAKLENIFQEIRTIDLFNNDKTIIIKNHPLVFNKNKELETFSNLNNQQIIFIYDIFDKLPSNDFIKYLKDNKVVFKEMSEIKNKEKFILQIIKEANGHINKDALEMLVCNLPLNSLIINNEVQILLNINKNINLEMVNNLSTKYIEDDFFAISNAILSKDDKNIIKNYLERIELGDDPIQIMNQIAKVLNQALIISHYLKQNFSYQQISAETNIHIFRVKKISEFCKVNSINIIKDLILKMTDLDHKIQLGQIDKKIGLDYLILNLLN